MSGPERSRLLRIAFLAILVFSAAQVVWWMLDQRRLIVEEKERTERLLEAQRGAARALAGLGAEEGTVAALLPALDDASGRPRELVELDRLHVRRLRQYLWEGGFFLAVLAASMAVIARTLREESRLRRRQQNFIASVTHELKSPLASLQLAAETIALRRPEGERLERLAGRMRGDVRRLETMVAKILDTASLEAGRLHLRKEPLELARVVGELVDEFSERARERGIELAAEVPEELRVAADPAATRTILRNLIDNALRATIAAGGGSVSLVAVPAEEGVELAVTDTGVGFDPGETERLFEKFYRPGDELRRTGRGTGLGLFVVRRFVELERGRVSAHSAGPGTGARFTVWWPRPSGEEAS